MKYLFVIFALLAPFIGAFAEKSANLTTTSQFNANTGSLTISSNNIEIGAPSEGEQKSNPLFSLFYIIPGVLIVLSVIFAIALSKRIFFEQ